MRTLTFRTFAVVVFTLRQCRIIKTIGTGDWGLDVQMTRTVTLVRRGQDQLVPLPVDWHLPTDRVRIRRHGRGVLIEPVFTNVREWFAELDSFGPEPFPDVRPTRVGRRRK